MAGLVTRSRRWQALKLLASASRPLVLAFVIDIALAGIAPLGLAIAVGQLVRHLPAAVESGQDFGLGSSLLRALAIVAVLFLVVMVASAYHQWFSSTSRSRLTGTMRRRLMAAVAQPISIAHLDDSRVLDDLATARGQVTSFSPANAPATLAAVLAHRLSWMLSCAIVGLYWWWLGLLLLGVWQYARRQSIRTVQQHVAAMGGNASVMRRADYFHRLATSAATGKELRLFGMGDWVVDQYRSHWIEGMAGLWKLRAGLSISFARLGLVLLVMYVTAAAVIGQAALNQSISLSEVTVLLPALFTTMISGGMTFDDLHLEWELAAIPSFESLERSVSDAIRDVQRNGQQVAGPKIAVRFENVEFRYGESTAPVFESLDLSIVAGRSTAVVGENGCGKTTLVKLLTRLQEPTSGCIVVDETPLRDILPSAWQKQVAAVFQDFMRLPLTVAENIGAGAVEHIADRDGIVAAASIAGARTFIESLPHQWDTVLSREFANGIDLSGGQWQRVALARALFAVHHGATVLVLDEPTSWLDARGEAEFFKTFLEITRGLTTLVISHRFSTVRLCDQICVLRAGVVEESGSHNELMAKNGHYARMFRVQAARFGEQDAGDFS